MAWPARTAIVGVLVPEKPIITSLQTAKGIVVLLDE
jgi:hypothetical protein